jgi:putative glutamine amidotransferase
VATAPDGAIEGVESLDDAWWMIGVQWHPEELTAGEEEWDRALFNAFADAVRVKHATPLAASVPRS